MDEAPDPADTAFRRLLNREILVSERRRMLSLAMVAAVIVALILTAVTFAPGFVRSIYHDRLPTRAALAAFSAFIAYELVAASLLTVLIRRGRKFPLLGRYMNALVETSFPTLLLYLLTGYLSAPLVFSTWPALLYFVFIILSTLRLDFALSAFTGAVAAVELFALAYVTLHLVWRTDDPNFSIAYHAARSGVLLAAGVLAGSVGVTIKSHFERALAADVGPRPGDQPVRPARLAARGRAAARHRRRRAQRDEAGLRDVRRHSRLHRSLAQPHAGRGRRPARRLFRDPGRHRRSAQRHREQVSGRRPARHLRGADRRSARGGERGRCGARDARAQSTPATSATPGRSASASASTSARRSPEPSARRAARNIR